MLHFALAQVLQVRLPVPILSQIFRHVPGQKNMSCIAAIEHSLGNVNSRTCHVRLVINIDDSIDRAAMNPHPHLNVRVILQGFADLKGTSHRLFRTVEKKERHPIAGRHSARATATPDSACPPATTRA